MLVLLGGMHRAGVRDHRASYPSVLLVGVGVRCVVALEASVARQRLDVASR